VSGTHRRTPTLIGTILGLTLAMAACSSPGTNDSVASGNDLPLATSDAPIPEASSVAPPPASPSAPASRKPAAAAKKVTYAFPVIGKNSYGHTHHDYPATDIITNCGNRVVAATSGIILTTTRKDGYKASVNAGATRGGLSVALLGDDGVRYYGSHMSVIGANIKPGVRVTTGQTLGKTGDTGDASACHLHFGISPPCAKTSDWWNQRGTVYPWPFLDAWKKGQNKSAASTVAAWQKKHGCPKKPLTDP
jgi:murein DD-endopeptidase MepM/ murein hydrolase activator NlpD